MTLEQQAMDDVNESYKIIEQIRLEFGIASDGSQQDSLRHILRNLTNAIEHLSTGLYEKETHFILELIQNAEDNSYGEVKPSLKFVLLKEDPTGTEDVDGCLAIFNNEIGFNEKNVRSICQIGESTKTKLAGYVGEKGIGFKSVFIVTPSPHIYSNGFRFKFKEIDPVACLSYIVPYWLNSMPEVVGQYASGGTAILLPLKRGKKDEIKSRLQAVSSETLLFLSKLESLEIQFDDETNVIEVSKNADQLPVIELLASADNEAHETQLYWIHKNKFSVPSSIVEEKRSNIKDREITVAFPLSETAVRGIIYAYLPTEVDSGFPFLINADFILTANREGIQHQKPWNAWLRDSLVEVIVNGIESLAKNTQYRKLLYGFIPLEKDVRLLKEYFVPVCKEVLKRLSVLPIVLDDGGKLVTSDQVIRASAQIRGLFPVNDRPNYFKNISFVDPDIEKYSEQLKSIGVKVFTTENLKVCLSDEKWMASRPVEWFSKLYDYLIEQKNLKKTDIKNLPLIPLSNGSLCKPLDRAFFPLEDSTPINLINSHSTPDFPSVKILNEDLSKLLIDNSEIRTWVRGVLNVMEFSISAYIGLTVIPWLISKEVALTEKRLFEAIQVILENWKDILDEHKGVIKTKLPLLLDDGSIALPEELNGHELLMPREMEKKKGWRNILKNIEDYNHEDVLSDKYVKYFSSHGERLTELLELLNAQRYPDLNEYVFYETNEHKLHYSEYISYVFSEYSDPSSSERKLTSWMPPSYFFDRSERERWKNRKALIYWLEGICSARKMEMNYGQLEWRYRGARSRQVISGLRYFLCKYPWVNTTKGLKKPGEVFIQTQQNKEIFGNYLAYLKDDISNDVCNFLDIKTEANQETILDYLSELSVEGVNVDIALVKKIYKYLGDYGKDYKEYFHDNAIIYVPSGNVRWYKAADVIWEDSSGALGNLYGWLSPSYESGGGFRGFFVEKIGVSESVQARDLMNVWVQLPAREDLRSEDVKVALGVIYSRLLKSINDCSSESLWQEFSGQFLMLTQSGTFQYAPDVYVPDDEKLRQLFRNTVDYVWKPDRLTHSELQPLYETLGIQKLSENIEISLERIGSHKVVDNSEYLTDFSKQLLFYMIYNENKEKYEHLKQTGVVEDLAKTKECEIECISLRYSLKNSWQSESKNEDVAYWDVSKRSLYLKQDIGREDLLDDIAEVVARKIWDRRHRDFVDKVRTLLAVDSEERFRKLRDKKGWHLPVEIKVELDTWIKTQEDDNSEHSDDCDWEEYQAKPAEGDVEAPNETVAEDGSDVATLHPEKEVSFDRPSKPSSRAANNYETDRSPPTIPSSWPPSFEISNGQQATRSVRGGKTRSSGIAGSINQARRNRLRSYVASELIDDCEPESEKTRENQELRNQLGEQAELRVLEDLQAKGYIAKRMPQNNPGYDIEVINPNTSESFYIEVKGDSYSWSDKGVGISSVQYDFASLKRGLFYLAVVENIRGSPTTIHYIRDPISYISEYRFDAGWQGLACNLKTLADRDNEEETHVRLMGLTDDPVCRKIVQFCQINNFPFPDIGMELVDENGKVVLENIELGWEQERIAVVLDGDFNVELQVETLKSLENAWECFKSSEFDSICQYLNKVFEID